ncbi:hypothetical protein [Clostridium sporogenes]|uniref:hypothetical protein n=1 Tax=Clostridium sporogenes TaxID=1509 RepID=UPI000717A8E0|nr:hypothetical protein [Clostridium sporogenes]KRU40021.1 hypothetical protein VT94_24980 [Clostridium sporogenes]MBY7065163.1 hypothetical protein [Clostridium sporogenes]MBY7071791.1 hypothetical protein [Clostridium sporogenes]MCW6064767.1 hypothetical protein [Clostridium sporogenes]OQP88581.1 hypothetical protein VT93_0202250 [Clostridium sporogenes]
MSNDEIDRCSIEDASKYAIKFCKKYPRWKRICDIENRGIFNNTSKIQYGFISCKGKFYKKITDIPKYHNSIMVVKIL